MDNTIIKEAAQMQPSPPKQVAFWAAVVTSLVGVVAGLVTIPFQSAFALRIVPLALVRLAAGLVMLALGTRKP